MKVTTVHALIVSVTIQTSEQNLFCDVRDFENAS